MRDSVFSESFTKGKVGNSVFYEQKTGYWKKTEREQSNRVLFNFTLSFILILYYISFNLMNERAEQKLYGTGLPFYQRVGNY